jgi:hypothetical protein
MLDMLHRKCLLVMRRLLPYHLNVNQVMLNDVVVIGYGTQEKRFHRRGFNR